MKEKKKVVVLGSTGSVGQSALDVLRHLTDDFQVEALCAKSNIERLIAQIQEFHPRYVALYEELHLPYLRSLFPNVKFVASMEGLEFVASLDHIDIVISAITGAIGILPTIAAIKKGRRIALANKEVLVAAGQYVMELAKKYGATILPIDSEHSAIFQCISASDPHSVGRLILTASGGPFYRYTAEQKESITKEMALKHPTWTMGAKISVDSSTLMNKGLEVIEACHLFSIEAEKIDVVIHPQSVIHSMVEFIDGSILSQMSSPNMHIPIQYALTYPHRKKGITSPFSFSQHPTLNFLPYVQGTFPCLDLAYWALETGGSMPCFLNACNEVLVDRFLQGEIRWIDIERGLQKLCLCHRADTIVSLEMVFEVDMLARQRAKELQFNVKVY